MEVFARGSRIQGYVAAAKHFEAGIESGSMFNFLFLHDFALPKPTTFLLFKSQEADTLSTFNDFAKGFLNGTNVAAALPSIQKCDFINDRVKANITQFINTLKNITIENYQQIINQLVPIGQDILNETLKTLPLCVGAVAEVQNLTTRIISHITQEGYLSKIFSHASLNFMEVFARGSRIQGYVAAAKHFEAGIESGSMFNFLLFHDIKATPSVLRKLSTAKGIGAYVDMIKGFVNGSNFIALIPSIGTCDPAGSAKIEELSAKIVEAINNFTDFSSLIKQLTNLTQEIIIELKNECGKAVQEYRAAVDRLLVHVRQDGYNTKAVMHAITNSQKLMELLGDIVKASIEEYEFGHKLGKFVNFLGFWDFQ